MGGHPKHSWRETWWLLSQLGARSLLVLSRATIPSSPPSTFQNPSPQPEAPCQQKRLPQKHGEAGTKLRRGRDSSWLPGPGWDGCMGNTSSGRAELSHNRI